MKPGSHRAIVTDHKWVTSQAGTPGLEISVDIPDDFGTVDCMVGTIWMSEKSMGMARRQLKNLGFNPDTQSVGDIGGSISLREREIEIQVEEDEYKGKKKLKINFFGGRSGAAPAKEQLSALDAALAAAKKSGEEEDDAYHGPSVPPPPQTPAEPVPLNPPPGTDEGIPF